MRHPVATHLPEERCGPLGRERIVADAESELVGDVNETVHRRRRGDEEQASAEEEAPEVVVAMGLRGSEVVALVHDHQPAPFGRESPKTDLGMTEDLEGNADSKG